MIALALICSLCLFFWPKSDAGQVCVVSWDGGEVTLPLTQTDTLTVESHGIRLTVAVADGGVRVTESGCPDGICTASGEIRHGGEIIVCVPADVVIRIPEDGHTGEDFIVG
jgi:hypothetical protein